MFIRAGERCAHCGAGTPLGGTCEICGGVICVRSRRIMEMAEDGIISGHWACPHAAGNGNGGNVMPGVPEMPAR